ncbi:MAG: hypothetical protein VKN13_03205 [Cyanobacteriota bacterium]|nr:hypothetical protein [Cyanobacteriota bacterium]
MGVGLICWGAALLVSLPVEAASVKRFVYDDPINGSVPASATGGSGTPPWLEAVISDLSAKDGRQGVSILFNSRLVDKSEFIGNVGFNLSDTLVMPKIESVTCLGLGCQGFSSIYGKPNAFSVNSGQASGGKVSGFDLGLVFGANGLSGRQSLTIEVLGDVNADLFDRFDNQPGGVGALTGLRTAAKVQGIQAGAGSGEVAGTDPPPQQAPAPLPLLGAWAALQASRRLRRRLIPAPASAVRSA